MGDIWSWIKAHPVYAVGGVVGLVGVYWYLSHRAASSSSVAPGSVGGTTTVGTGGTSGTSSTSSTGSGGGGGGLAPVLPFEPSPTNSSPSSAIGAKTAATSSTSSTSSSPTFAVPTTVVHPTASVSPSTAAAINQFNSGVAPIERVSPAAGQSVTYDPTTQTYNGVVTAPSGQELAGLGTLSDAQSNAIARENAQSLGIGEISQSGQYYGPLPYGVTPAQEAAISARVAQVDALPGG